MAKKANFCVTLVFEILTYAFVCCGFSHFASLELHLFIHFYQLVVIKKKEQFEFQTALIALFSLLAVKFLNVDCVSHLLAPCN